MTKFQVGDVVMIDDDCETNTPEKRYAMAKEGVHPGIAYIIYRIETNSTNDDILYFHPTITDSGWWEFRFKLVEPKPRQIALFNDLAERDRAIAESFLLGFSLS